MNFLLGAQLADYRCVPSKFPGGARSLGFQYTCESAPPPCKPARGRENGVPNNIRDVDIPLIVLTRLIDLQRSN